jgi:peptidoglycan-N-acetylglucosamine deacetylase
MRVRMMVGAVVLALVMALGMGVVMTAHAEGADAAPAASWVYHKVKHGETLSGVALHYGVSWYAIASANGLHYPYTIYAGKVLKIPHYAAPHHPVHHKHLVKKGETVYSIARWYGVSVSSIIAANGLHYPYTIYAGRYLTIWGGGHGHPTPGTYHVVKHGDTLIRIGQYHGVPWGDIAMANGLAYPFTIRVGQTLRIPSGHTWWH